MATIQALECEDSLFKTAKADGAKVVVNKVTSHIRVHICPDLSCELVLGDDHGGLEVTITSVDRDGTTWAEENLWERPHSAAPFTEEGFSVGFA
jgi:hypothetical protein